MTLELSEEAVALLKELLNSELILSTPVNRIHIIGNLISEIRDALDLAK